MSGGFNKVALACGYKNAEVVSTRKELINFIEMLLKFIFEFPAKIKRKKPKEI